MTIDQALVWLYDGFDIYIIAILYYNIVIIVLYYYMGFIWYSYVHDIEKESMYYYVWYISIYTIIIIIIIINKRRIITQAV